MLVILSLEANILFSTKDTREYFFIYQVLLAPSFLSIRRGNQENGYHKEYAKHLVLYGDLETNPKELTKQRSEDYLWLSEVPEMSELEKTPAHELRSL